MHRRSNTYLLSLISIVLALALSGCGKGDAITVEPGEGPETPVGPGEDDGDDADDVDWDKAVSYVFDASVIPEIHISVPQAEWDQLLKYYEADSNTQEYVRCEVRYVKGGSETLLPDSGLRLKGNTSRRWPGDAKSPQHVHFGLNFHKFFPDEDHTLKGLRKMDLKWFKDDAAYVREIYCYDLFRRFGVWTAIRDIYARLWIRIGDHSEKYYGVYGMMEHIDKNYLRIRRKEFGGKDGNLWKCAWGSSLRDVNASMGVDDNRHTYSYELKTNKETGFEAAKAQLRNFIQGVASKSGADFDKWIASVMDVDLLLRTYAVIVAVGMWDDYWGNTNNYYLYFTTTEPEKYKVYMIPYDYDNTLGTSHIVSDSGRQDPYNWGSSDIPLVYKILQNKTWRARYRSYLRDLCLGSGLSSPAVAKDRIRAWQSSISSFVSNDTGQDMKIEDRPASWGNHSEYRLLGGNASTNWFEVKAATVSSMQ